MSSHARSHRFQLEDEPEGVSEPSLLMNSMIDVIFILLACFICVSELRRDTVDVALSEAPTAQSEGIPRAEPVRITITKDDKIRLDGAPMADREHLEQRLQALAEVHGSELEVEIAGDREARNGTVMGVIGLLARYNLTRLAFAVETEQP